MKITVINKYRLLYNSIFSLSMEISRLTRDGTAEPVSRGQIFRHVREQGNINFPCSADHEQIWKPYPVHPYSAYRLYVMTIHTYIVYFILLFILVRTRDGPRPA